MALLRCPRCSTTVQLVQGLTPVCPACGFGAPAAPKGAPSMAPHTPSPPAPYAAAPMAMAPAQRRRGPIIAAIAVAGVLLVGGALAAVYFTGGFTPNGGSVTEGQLKAALAGMSDAMEGEGSSEAIGMVGNAKGAPGGGEDVDFPADMQFEFRMLHDPAGAYEFAYEGGGGGFSVDIAVKQKGKVINYVQGATVSVGRDEDPSTLPSFMDGEDGGEFGSPGEIFEEEGVVIDSIEGVKHKGKPATKFTIHNTEEPGVGTVIVYDGSKKVAWMSFQAEGMKVEMDILYGKEVSVSVTDKGEKASFSLGGDGFMGGGSQDCDYDFQGSGPRTCTVPDDHVQEVKLGEVELRFVRGSSGSASESDVLAKLRLDRGTATSQGVTLTYTDVDADGLVSAGDTYSHQAPQDTYGQAQFFDLWANKPAGGPMAGMPGFEALGLILACLGAAMLVARRRA